MCAYSFLLTGKRTRAILLLEAFSKFQTFPDIAIDFSGCFRAYSQLFL